MDIEPSVIIPARNAAADLETCLAAVWGGQSGARPGEVIVVDDGSDDDTAEVARRCGARVLVAKGKGPAAARNRGARAAGGEILVFLDADCVPEPGCLEALLRPFTDASVVGVRGAYTSRQREVMARFTQLELEEKQARLAASGCIAVVDTACAAYRREAFLAVGGFDESFPATSAEDVELSFRLVERGARLVYAPEARVRHRHPASPRRYAWRKLRFGFFRARLYGRYPRRLQDDGYTPRLMPLQIVLSLGLVATLGASTRAPRAGWAAAAAAAAFGASSVPLVRRAWRTDPGLAAWVPPLLLLRSLAQGSGLATGTLALAADRLVKLADGGGGADRCA